MIDQSLNDVAVALLRNALNIEDRATRGCFVKFWLDQLPGFSNHVIFIFCFIV